jgi:LuxR family maltose regulon positive regulatory protein
MVAPSFEVERNVRFGTGSFDSARDVPLLRTKLYIPPLRPGLVLRPRLIERLNAGLGQNGSFVRKLTLISAPAGFGKTTLLGEWIAGCEWPIVWLSLDEGDNDPARFLLYLVAALQTIEARQSAVGRIGEDVLNAFQSPRSLPVEPILTSLINEIAEGLDTFTLILDDYHVIEAQRIHNALTFLLDHLPPRMHLVIASRTDPPLPLARLRARGQLAEFHAADLRFTADETAAFLNQVMGLSLSAKEIATLETRTEGWVAGLQLVALSMQGRDDVAGFIHAFTGSHRYVLDYLAEEVLARQPQNIQAFLLHTSILNRLSAPLCDAVVGIGDSPGQPIGKPTSRETGGFKTCGFVDSSEQILEHLERNNLFIVPMDDERRWYRYHRLFADFLRARLERDSGASLPERGSIVLLHRRAAEWYERNGLQTEAVGHALAARDFEWAARLIEQVAWQTLMRGEVNTLLNWLGVLPEEIICARPNLCIIHAWALFLTAQPMEAIETRLRDAAASEGEGAARAEQDLDRFQGLSAVLRVLLTLFQGDASHTAELSHQTLERLPKENKFLHSLLVLNQSISLAWSGNFPAAGQAYAKAARLGLETGSTLLTLFATCQLAELQMIQGRLCQAMRTYRQARQLASGPDGRPLPLAGVVLIGMGELLREWNDLDAATRHLTEGIELCQQWGEILAFDGYISLARVRWAQGDADSALDLFQKVAQLARRFDVTEMDDWLVAAQQARLWIAQGNLEAANQWAAEQRRHVGGQTEDTSYSFFVHEWEQFTLARLFIVQDKAQEALALLAPLLLAAESARRMGNVIENLVIQAMAHQAQSDTSQALTALARALALAEPEGYVRIFVDEGTPMAELLRSAAVRGIAPGYVGKLLAAFDAPHFLISPSLPLSEPLSERELEVLRLIAAGLSNREIARQLVIELSTVKWHINNLYGKLNVHSRTQAVARARELSLL